MIPEPEASAAKPDVEDEPWQNHRMDGQNGSDKERSTPSKQSNVDALAATNLGKDGVKLAHAKAKLNGFEGKFAQQMRQGRIPRWQQRQQRRPFVSIHL